MALHRSVIAEASRFPDLAAHFYSTGPRHSIG
ncbi:TetR/AcrR family transcriptional regulator C-terminal domain-containing protein [Mycetocola sp. CAN_C7]